MPRSTAEWIGRTDDTPVPDRVRLRVLHRFGSTCDAATHGCGRDIRPGDTWSCDHIQPLILSGANRESNLHPLCNWCHPVKTADETKTKSENYQRAKRHAGIKSRPWRPLVGTIASGWKHRMDGRWERR